MIVWIFVIGFLTLMVLAGIHARRQWRKAQEMADRATTTTRRRRAKGQSNE